MNTKQQINLEVPTWANNAHKASLDRKYQEQRKQARERKHVRNVALLMAFYVTLIVLYGWLNSI